MKTYTVDEHTLLCILESLEESIERLPYMSDGWAHAFDAANDVRKILGRPLVKPD